MYVGIVGTLLLTFVAMLGAERLGRVLPEALVHFFTRVLGLLLSAIAVQLVVNGIRGLV